MKLFGKIALAMASPWTSRKLWMTILGVLIVQSLYWVSVWYLYSFTEQWKGELFYKMFASTAWTISMMMLGYLGLQTLASGWTNTTANTASSVLNTILEHKQEEITIRTEGGAKAFSDIE
jgi:hypothetical protein